MANINQPLQDKVYTGVNVLDFSGVIAGSYCTKMLSDLGANVLKVEHPQGEIMRKVAPMRGQNSAVYAALNFGKRNISLDLKKPEAISICKRLIKKYDVVVENFSPGVMKRLGLGYEELRKTNPKLIMCSISGYGQRGPASNKPAYAPIVQAASGFDLTYLNAQNDPAKPLNMGPPVGDTTASLQAFGAIGAALFYRSNTETGQHIDIAMIDCLIASMHRDLQSSLLNEDVGRQYGPIATKDGYVVIMPLSQSQFINLVKCLERTDLLNDSRFATESVRFENYNELMTIAENWSANLDSKQVLETFEEAKIPCAQYKTLKQAVNDPQLRYRGLMMEIVDDIGSFQAAGTPIKYSNARPNGNTSVSSIGEHSVSTLMEELFMSEPEIQQLIKEKVIFQP